MKVYFAADHAGFEMKNALVTFVRSLGHEAIDYGADAFDANDDYPPIIARAGKALSEDAKKGEDSRAIVLGGSGQGEAVVMNRFKGVRCALFHGGSMTQTDMSGHTFDMLVSTRVHNNSNALSLAARFLSQEEAQKAVESWLSTPFSGEERHVRRIKQIDDIT
jgi:ribose 5-phosphate isomerase B